MKKTQETNALTLLGAFVTITGLLLLAMTNGWFGLDKNTGWPLYIFLTGLALLLPLAKNPSPFLGTLVGFFAAELVLLGVFFLKFTLGLFTWEAMGSLWPSFILIPGLALLFAYVVSGRRYSLLSSLGGTLAVIAVLLLLLLQLAGSYIDFGQAWPVFVIVSGVALLIVPQLRNRK